MSTDEMRQKAKRDGKRGMEARGVDLPILNKAMLLIRSHILSYWS